MERSALPTRTPLGDHALYSSLLRRPIQPFLLYVAGDGRWNVVENRTVLTDAGADILAADLELSHVHNMDLLPNRWETLRYRIPVNRLPGGALHDDKAELRENRIGLVPRA